MNNDYFQNETAEKTFGFKVILTLVALMILSIIGIRIFTMIGAGSDVALDPTLQPDPVWYNYSVVLLGLISLAGICFTWMYRKIGIYMVAISLFLIVLLNPEFSLLKTLAPLFTLFIFVGFGLFEIIPKWKFFK